MVQTGNDGISEDIVAHRAICGGVHFPADPLIDYDTPETTRRYLARWGFPPVVVRVPRFDVGGPYPEIDFAELFT